MPDGDAVDSAPVADHMRGQLPLDHHAYDGFKVDGSRVREVRRLTAWHLWRQVCGYFGLRRTN